MEAEEFKLNKLKIVLKETTEAHQLQQSGIDLIFGKLNWILVANVVFLAALYNAENASSVVILLLTFSILFSLIGLDPQDFKTTAKLSDQLEVASNEENNEAGYLEALINKKIEAFNANQSRVDEIGTFLTFSKGLFILALAYQLVPVIAEFFK